MKKLLFSLIISGTSVWAFAQTPTWDFDTPPWTGTGASIEPSGWVSENAVVIPPILSNPQSVFQSTISCQGTYAMQITSVTMATNPAPTLLPNPVGLAATGAIVLTPSAKLTFGFQYTARPQSVSFCYKYIPVAGDEAEFLITLWNGSLHDTVATGYWSTSTGVPAYTQQTVTLTYNPLHTNIFPDSMALVFSSTKLFNPNYSLCLTCGKAGSNLYVDDITFSGWNSVSETEMTKGVSVFPNPASEFTTITVEDINEASLVEIFDITGRLITTIPFSESANALNKKSAVIPTQKMSAGLYSLSVYDNSEHLLRNGKLSVVK